MLEYAAEGELYRKVELCGRFEEPIAAKVSTHHMDLSP